MRIATNVITLVAGLSLAAAAPVFAEAGATPVDLGAECEAILATLPDTAAEPQTPGWPHHDPLLDAMVPDVIDGTEQWHLLVTGADPIEENATDRQLAIAAGQDPEDYRAAWALPEAQPQSVYAIRVVGATPRQTLDAILTRRVFPVFEGEPFEATCTGDVVDGQAMLRLSAWTGDALLLPSGDAWLVATASKDHLQALEPELRSHLLRVAAAGAQPPPIEAPVIGTRLAPPASAADLAAMLPTAIDGTPIAYLGQTPGQLGLGMVPYAFLGVMDIMTRVIAPDLDVDLSVVWGDTGSSVTTGTESSAVTISVLTDLSGDGARWIEPYMNVRIDPETFRPDPSAAPLFPEGTFTAMEVGGKDVMAGGSDKQDWLYLYASGPWFFTIRADTATHGAELLASLP